MLITDIKPNLIVRGPIFPEPVQVLVVVPMGESVKVIGKGLRNSAARSRSSARPAWDTLRTASPILNRSSTSS
jgi:hypothetical protein